MIKWFVYIVVLLIFAPCLSSAKIKNNHFNVISDKLGISLPFKELLVDTTNTKNNKKQEPEEKKKIKEVANAKRQPKPEKIESTDHSATSKPKPKPKRQRRPEGMERPPEIPRRNGT
jgi:hypothetical protein